MENPFGAGSKLVRAVGVPAIAISPWQFGDPNDLRNLVNKPTGLWCGLNNSTNGSPNAIAARIRAQARTSKPRRVLPAAKWMDRWGGNAAENRFAREATPPGMARMYTTCLLLP